MVENNECAGVLCAVCKTEEAMQQHHLSYEPELKIDVCVKCHVTLHGHGVGVGAGNKKNDINMQTEDEDTELYLPKFTREVLKDGKSYIVWDTIDPKTLDPIDGDLTLLICPNCKTSSFHLFGSLDDNRRIFLRCYRCGFECCVGGLIT